MIDICSDILELPSEINAGNVQEYVVDIVWPAFQMEREKLRLIAMWSRGATQELLLPPRNSPEKLALMEYSKTPWLGLIVDSFSQCLYVDGYRAAGQKNNVPVAWQAWRANRMKSRQTGIHRATIMYGKAYARVLPGTGLGGVKQASIKGYSPRRLFPMYEDPVNDEYPMYALELMQDGKTVQFYTDTNIFQFAIPFRGQPTGTNLNPVITKTHQVGVCPFVRYLNVDDLDGAVRGEVEKLVMVACRLDKTMYDRLLVQHYNSVKIKWATGVDELGEDSDPATGEAIKLKISNEDVLMHGNPDVKFGTLPETALDGFITAYDADLEALAAVAQLPSNGLTGKLANLSADALASARANTTQKLYERQTMLGESHAQLMRLSAFVSGDADGAQDFDAEITWQDMEVRSLAQAVDAWGKAAQMLGVPKWATWRKLPNVSEDEAQMWYQNLLDNDPESEFLRYYGLSGGQQEPPGDSDPVEGPPAAGTPAAPVSVPPGADQLAA